MELNSSWLNGKYPNAEINTFFPFVSIGEDYFSQGDEAEKIIDEIHAIWVNNDHLTIEESIEFWKQLYL